MNTFGIAATAYDSSPSPFSAALTLAILVLLVVTRIRGRPLRRKRVVILPLVLMALGLAATLPPALKGHLYAVDYAVIAGDALLSVALGGIRGYTVILYRRDNVTWYRYGPLTVLLWVLSIVLRIVLAVVATQLGATSVITGNSLMFWLGTTLLTQNILLLTRSSTTYVSSSP
ncbi:CcdC protein domain-containing protein [Fodinicola acaciae]|uniref:CcdC protein domain-containing protein n=1 Tax=Fodinicola acaciae TaxID=2681555 RepID=UPI0013D58EFD|nr:CcdC protein domain-containing protein [Fodinicola acaciae]